MTKLKILSLKKIFNSYPAVKLAYFFGSRNRKDVGPLSDYDFAVYLDEKDSKNFFDLKFKIQNEICRLFKTDKVDLVVLNLTESPELKFNIIKDGQLIFERSPYRVIVEPKILNEYFDFHSLLLRHKLTKV